jgi:hypothetical protein
MSPIGALVVVLAALLVLASLAAWLLNVPLWAIGAFSLAGVLAIRATFRRLVNRRARQDTEARPLR